MLFRSESQFDTVRANRKLYDRSLYMYILMYNRLPQELVEAPTVSSFQSRLTKLAKGRADREEASWRCAFRDCKDVVDFFYASNA